MRLSSRWMTFSVVAVVLIVVAILVAALGSRSPSHTNASSPSPASSSAQTTQTTPTQSTSSTPSASEAAPTPAPVDTSAIAFRDCTAQIRNIDTSARARQMQFSCGTLAVPLDYANPSGQKLSIFVLREHLISQTASQRVGSLLMNPGGPGGSGIDFAVGVLDQMPMTILQHFDLIGFDPRGVGLSSPISCISDLQKDKNALLDPDPRTADGRTIAKAEYAAIASTCKAKYGSALTHFTTEETARDMDLIRAAVGDDKLNYLGFSYGTRLGAAYAHLFPTTIRVAVLDGALDPVTPELAQDERQAAGFESAYGQFSTWCLKQAGCSSLQNPLQAAIALVKSADASPIPSSKAGETRKATGGIVLTGIASALYEQSQWPTLATALVDARKGDSAGLFALADSYYERDAQGQYSNEIDANTAINCADSTLRPTDAQVEAAADSWATKYPLFGANFAASLYTCDGWSLSANPLPPASAPGAPPILVVGTVHDPATPYAATKLLANALGSGVVLSWDGQGHTAYLKSTCIDNAVDSYLITAKVASTDSCPAG